MPKLVKSHPETKIQNSIRIYLEDRGWIVIRLIGVQFQSGLPDLLTGHPKYGIRFVEVKYADSYRFTKAQRWRLPELMKHGIGVWVLVGANEEEYDKLFQPPNLFDYLAEKDIITQSTIDDALLELE